MGTLLFFFIAALVIYAALSVAYVLFQHKFLFRSKKLQKDFEHPCHLPHEELFLPTADGETINALWVQSKHRKGMVIYYHGNMLHLTNYLPYIYKFTDEGYDVLIADYRGFGKSTGTLTEENFYGDSLMIFDWAKNKLPNVPLMAYGRSMGTAAACCVASQRDCRHLILEAPFFNLHDLSWFYGLVVPKNVKLKFSFRNNDFLPKVKSPVTIFHGTRDSIVSYKSGRKLQAFLKDGDQFITIAGGGHNNLEQFGQYHSELERVLGNHEAERE
jgi:hypothetical protein